MVDKRRGERPLVVPYTIVVDGREKQPYTFQGLIGDARQQFRPLIVNWRWAHLKTGDYSIEGCEDLIAIERKTLEDLYSTLGGHRKRFEAEIQRLNEMYWAGVVIESTWPEALRRPPQRSRLHPKSVSRTIIAWMLRYHRVHWQLVGGREMTERITFRLLDRFWQDREKGLFDDLTTTTITDRVDLAGA